MQSLAPVTAERGTKQNGYVQPILDCDAILLVMLTVNTGTGYWLTYPVSRTMYWNTELEVLSFKSQVISYELRVLSSRFLVLS